MRRRQPIKSGAKRHVTRPVLAAVLVLAALASAAPPDAVFAMVCCEGMGGAMKDSCPFMRLKGLLRKGHAQSEPECHAGMSMPSSGEAVRGEDAPPELFPATEADGAEHHHHDQSASPQDTTTQATVSSVAAVSKPCSSDSCCQANNLTRTRRPREHAATSNKFRPRPPTSEVGQRGAPAVLQEYTAARRLSPARAPPASL
jgi:hypothetical protein